MIRSTLAALTKHTIGRVRRRTSTKHRSMTLVVRSVRQRCRGKSKGQRPKVRRSGYVIWNHGAPGGIRTPDLQIRSLPLYPTELQALNHLRAIGSKISPIFPPFSSDAIVVSTPTPELPPFDAVGSAVAGAP